MFRATLNANEHGEPVSVGFPISKSVYADTITKLQQQSMGHVVNQDCRVEEIISSAFPVLRRVLFEEDEQRNGRDLPLAMGRGIWSLRGRGCSLTARGRSVRCVCLGDVEQTRWNRNEFVGVLKDEFLPDWARENSKQYMPQQTEHREMEMSL